MAGQLDSSSGSGFFHPFARSVSAPTAKSTPATLPAAAPDSSRQPAARREDIPSSGGFVNPQARPGRQ
jgi:hypothetical protein